MRRISKKGIVQDFTDLLIFLFVMFFALFFVQFILNNHTNTVESYSEEQVFVFHQNVQLHAYLQHPIFVDGSTQTMLGLITKTIVENEDSLWEEKTTAFLQQYEIDGGIRVYNARTEELLLEAGAVSSGGQTYQTQVMIENPNVGNQSLLIQLVSRKVS